MEFDWRLYFSLASELAAEGTEQAYRAAISRAYYAVFGTARQLLEQQGYHLTHTAGIHHQVWYIYRTSHHREMQRAYPLAAYLRDLRNQADYDPVMINLPNIWENVYHKAYSFFSIVDERLKPQVKSLHGD